MQLGVVVGDHRPGEVADGLVQSQQGQPGADLVADFASRSSASRTVCWIAVQAELRVVELDQLVQYGGQGLLQPVLVGRIRAEQTLPERCAARLDTHPGVHRLGGVRVRAHGRTGCPRAGSTARRRSATTSVRRRHSRRRPARCPALPLRGISSMVAVSTRFGPELIGAVADQDHPGQPIGASDGGQLPGERGSGLSDRGCRGQVDPHGQGDLARSHQHGDDRLAGMEADQVRDDGSRSDACRTVIRGRDFGRMAAPAHGRDPVATGVSVMLGQDAYADPDRPGSAKSVDIAQIGICEPVDDLLLRLAIEQALRYRGPGNGQPRRARLRHGWYGSAAPRTVLRAVEFGRTGRAPSSRSSPRSPVRRRPRVRSNRCVQP